MLRAEKEKLKNRKVLTSREVQDTWKWFENIGWVNSNKWSVKNYSKLNNSLKNVPCVVIGSSIAAKGLDYSNLHKIKTLCVNHAIEECCQSDMLLFQDQRFLKHTKFDLNSYKGLVFTSNTNPFGRKENKRNVVYFKPLQVGHNPTMDFNRGVYTRKSSGVCALNVALILGCSPVYLIGMDTPKEFNDSYQDGEQLHYKENYGNAPNTKQALDAYTSIAKNLFSKFSVYGPRIINVCENGHLDYFNSMGLEQFNRMLKAW
jgi:hypothetical protein